MGTEIFSDDAELAEGFVEAPINAVEALINHRELFVDGTKAGAHLGPKTIDVLTNRVERYAHLGVHAPTVAGLRPATQEDRIRYTSIGAQTFDQEIGERLDRLVIAVP